MSARQEQDYAYDFEDLDYEEKTEDWFHLDGDDDFVYKGSGADQDHIPDGVQDHHEETLPEEPSYVVPDVNVTSILCPEHKAKITPDCSRCEAVKAALPPDLLKQLAESSASFTAIPDASSRLTSSRPQPKASLVLMDTSLNYGKDVYYALPLSKPQFDKMVREHALLGPEQNFDLMSNLNLSGILKNSMTSGAMKDITGLIIKNRKNQRIAERSLLVAIDKLNESIRTLKGLGMSIGIAFPSEAPEVTLMGPNPIQDHLAFSSDENVFPLPDFPNFFEDLDLDDEVKKVLQGRLQVRDTAMQGFKTMAKESMKLLMMLTPSVRRHITGELLSKKELEEFRRESTGVMGGTAL